MISQLANEVFERTKAFGHLKEIVSQAEAVHDIETLLDGIGAELYKWAAVFPILMPLIASERAEAIHADAATIAHQLSTSRDEFVHQNFQQAIKLTQLKSKTERLLISTREAWTEYARQKVTPYRELTLIAERLPKMTRHLDSIHRELVNAQKQTIDLPVKPEVIEQFHACLDKLETLLSDLEGLPSDVRIFLDKLMKDDATFADVTQEVFEWCRAEGLAEKLRIARL
jgi:chromosome segregation ATPase